MPITSYTGPPPPRRRATSNTQPETQPVTQPPQRRRILSLSASYGDPNLTRPETASEGDTIDMSGNAQSMGATGRRSEQTAQRRRVIQVTGSKPPQSNQVLQTGDSEVLASEITTGQTGMVYGVPQAPIVMISDPNVVNLYKKYYTTYDEYRRIRKDPTIALCRAVIASPILSGNWTVRSKEGVEPELVKFITDQLFKQRFHIMEKAIYGMIDFGWQGYEKVYGVEMWTPPREEEKPPEEKPPEMPQKKPLPLPPKLDEFGQIMPKDPIIEHDEAHEKAVTEYTIKKKEYDERMKAKALLDMPVPQKKMVVLKKIKPLLQDMTSIMVYLYSGDFAGFRQGIVFVEAPAKAVLISYRVEGTMWHGYPLLEECRETVEKWDNVEIGAQRYDMKIAGSHFVVYYPMGSSNVGGVQINNSDIAADIIRGLEAGGSMSIPNVLQQYVEGMEAVGGDERGSAWKIEFIEARATRQSNFIDRLKYLDQLKCRAMHIPERAITEGQFGTKAESQGHADIMTVILQNIDQQITDSINKQVVDHLLALNYGLDAVGQVWLESSPISDDRISYARSLFSGMLTNQNMGQAIFPHIDFSALMQEVEIPKNKEVIHQPGQEVGQLQQGEPGAPGAPPQMPQPGQPGGPPDVPGAESFEPPPGKEDGAKPGPFGQKPNPFAPKPSPFGQKPNPFAPKGQNAVAGQPAVDEEGQAKHKAIAQQMGIEPGHAKTLVEIVNHMRGDGQARGSQPAGKPPVVPAGAPPATDAEPEPVEGKRPVPKNFR